MICESCILWLGYLIVVEVIYIFLTTTILVTSDIFMTSNVPVTSKMLWWVIYLCQVTPLSWVTPFTTNNVFTVGLNSNTPTVLQKRSWVGSGPFWGSIALSDRPTHCKKASPSLTDRSSILFCVGISNHIRSTFDWMSSRRPAVLTPTSLILITQEKRKLRFVRFPHIGGQSNTASK